MTVPKEDTWLGKACRLRSGGPLMTVFEETNSGKDFLIMGDLVNCMWFDGNTFHKQIFLREQLILEGKWDLYGNPSEPNGEENIHDKPGKWMFVPDDCQLMKKPLPYLWASPPTTAVVTRTVIWLSPAQMAITTAVRPVCVSIPPQHIPQAIVVTGKGKSV